MATAYIQFTSRLKSTSQEGILAEAQQIAVSATDKTDIKTYVDSKVGNVAGSVYRPKGSVTAAQLKALTSAAVGDVYNVSDALTLGSKTYPAGSNVACIKAFSSAVTPDETYWDVFGGFVDLSPYAKSTDLSSAKTDLQGKIDAANSSISNTNLAVTELKTRVEATETALDDVYSKDEVDSAITAAKYVLPRATTTTLGGVAISGSASNDNLPSNHAKINIGGASQIYVPAVSTSASGAMTPALFNKLNNIAAGAQVNVIETVMVNGTALTPTDKAVNIDLSDYAEASALDETKQAVDKLQADLYTTNSLLNNYATKDSVTAAFNQYQSALDRLMARVDALENLLKLV